MIAPLRKRADVHAGVGVGFHLGDVLLVIPDQLFVVILGDEGAVVMCG